MTAARTRLRVLTAAADSLTTGSRQDWAFSKWAGTVAVIGKVRRMAPWLSEQGIDAVGSAKCKYTAENNAQRAQLSTVAIKGKTQNTLKRLQSGPVTAQDPSGWDLGGQADPRA